MDEKIFDNVLIACTTCKKGKPHISRCFSENGMCKYFPYDMGNNTEDLYENKYSAVEMKGNFLEFYKYEEAD